MPFVSIFKLFSRRFLANIIHFCNGMSNSRNKLQPPSQSICSKISCLPFSSVTHTHSFLAKNYWYGFEKIWSILRDKFSLVSRAFYSQISNDSKVKYCLTNISGFRMNKAICLVRKDLKPLSALNNRLPYTIKTLTGGLKSILRVVKLPCLKRSFILYLKTFILATYNSVNIQSMNHYRKRSI